MHLEPLDTPSVFRHGIFSDKSLWRDYDSSLTGRSRIFIDMQAHGGSANVGRDWKLEECVAMLHTILDSLGFQSCILIGHPWGSMIALQAASKRPQYFAVLGLFNIPFRELTGLRR